MILLFVNQSFKLEKKLIFERMNFVSENAFVLTDVEIGTYYESKKVEKFEGVQEQINKLMKNLKYQILLNNK